MATEGATGLSTEALEDVIDWREQSHNAQAARAELAALTGRVDVLTTALRLARDTFQALRDGLRDEFWPGRAVSGEDGLAMFRLLDQAQRGVAAALADAGPGAAGARDEAGRAAALARLVEAGRALPFVWAYLRADDPGALDLSRAERAFCAALTPLLDAPRAGGAGDAGDQPR
jgi:hypothetical protein